MTGLFREGHNKRPMRRNGPLIIGPDRNPWRKRAMLIVPALLLVAIAGLFFAQRASAHPGSAQHVHILQQPIAGVRNNYWYDYRSDVEEAEIELRKDLRRAKTAQDKREAWQEYNRELRDATHDYRKEMVEKGYVLRRGEVTVGG